MRLLSEPSLELGVFDSAVGHFQRCTITVDGLAVTFPFFTSLFDRVLNRFENITYTIVFVI